MKVCFTVPGQPVAKGRPKFARRGAFVRAYTPEKTVNYESLVSLAAAQAMAGAKPTDRPVSLNVTINLQIPASWSKKRTEQARLGFIAATKKPDADNVLKAIKDGMNGIVFIDDAQVVALSLTKRYSDSPGVDVCAMALNIQPA